MRAAIVAIAALAATAAAYCQDPPYPYYMQSYDTANVYFAGSSTPSASFTGGQFGYMVVDTVSRRIYHHLTDLSSATPLEVQSWTFFDPYSPATFGSTSCSMYNGQCFCQWAPFRYNPVIPSTATLSAKRTVMGYPAFLYYNVSNIWTAEITVNEQCIPSAVKLMNRVDIPGSHYGGSLSTYFDFGAVSQQDVDRIMTLPSICHTNGLSKVNPRNSPAPEWAKLRPIHGSF